MQSGEIKISLTEMKSARSIKMVYRCRVQAVAKVKAEAYRKLAYILWRHPATVKTIKEGNMSEVIRSDDIPEVWQYLGRLSVELLTFQLNRIQETKEIILSLLHHI